MGQKYLVSGTLNHGVLLDELNEDGSRKVRYDVYKDGQEFSTDDAALEASLRAGGTILLPEEYAADALASGNSNPAQELAALRQQLQDENALLKAQIAELAALKASGSKSAKNAD